MRKLLFKGAIAAIALLTPAWAVAGEAEDKAMANQIAMNLKESGRLRDYQIGVAYREGTAWLSGTVTNAEQLVAALEIAQQSEGVTQVVNRLSTPGAAAQPRNASSRNMTSRLRSSLDAMEADEAAPARRATSQIQLATSMEEQVAAQAKRQSTWPVRQQQTPSAVAVGRPQQRQQQQQRQPAYTANRTNAPLAYARTAMNQENCAPGDMGGGMGGPMPAHVPGAGGIAPAAYDHAHMPGYAWPSYASYPNYAAVTYPRQYSPTAWPYIGPFYPYPQVPLGWRKVVLQWDDGWWQLDFKEK